jgi:hypothetical protein
MLELSRALRFRLRSLLVMIAFLGLLLTVILQAVWLNRSALRAARLQAELLRQRALAEASRDRALAAVDQFHARIAEQSAAGDAMPEQLRQESLERALKFYEDMASQAATPAEKKKVLERVKQIRSGLAGKGDEGKL